MEKRIDRHTTWGSTVLLLVCAVAGCLNREALSDGQISGPDAQRDGPGKDDLGGPPCPHSKVVKNCTGGWCDIPAGCFVMGSSTSEPCRNDNEDRHKVTLTRGFTIHQTEVTQDEFLAVMGYDPSGFGPNGKYGYCGPTCPVESVSWHEAAAYCNALSAKEGVPACYHCTGKTPYVICEEAPAYSSAKVYACPGYRLPTEAEFEYAYRAGTQTAYYNGPNDPNQCDSCGPIDANLDKIAWYCTNAGQQPLPVKQKLPNAWGLYDMAGSMTELCHDRYQEHLGSAAATDPWGSASNVARVRRGGSWMPSASYLRAAWRGENSQSFKWIELGFRCVRTTGSAP